MSSSYLKKLFGLFACAIIVLVALSYANAMFENNGKTINITAPAFNSAIDGIIKISAKTSGNPYDVKFVFTNNQEDIIKTVDAYFEADEKEWAYYLNSVEFDNGEYKISANAYYDKGVISRSLQKIAIKNKVKRTVPKKQPVYKKRPPSLPKIKEEKVENKIAAAKSYLKEESKIEEEIVVEEVEKEQQENINPEPKEEKTENIEEEMNIENKTEEAPIIENEIEKKETPSNSDEKILNGVVKALSNIYDNLNSNLTDDNSSGKVAGEEISNDEGGAENNWFNYDLKIMDLEAGSAISSSTEITAVCSNPLDSVDFIMDNLQTQKIDYILPAKNNYGYYTHWKANVEPARIKKGEYLLYAKGTIDWHTYESPIVIVNVD